MEERGHKTRGRRRVNSAAASTRPPKPSNQSKSSNPSVESGPVIVSLLSSTNPNSTAALLQSKPQPIPTVKTIKSRTQLNTNTVDAHGNLIQMGHPRDFVPLDVGFPTPLTAYPVQPMDREDRLLMATCSILLEHGNRALCPKEIAEVMFEKGWLQNAGTFAHVSASIRAHLRRAMIAEPPYPPLLTAFELTGALSPNQIRAVGLSAAARPAVKRGTLWYLDETVFGSGVGADDPFERCRIEAGLAPDKNGVRHLPPFASSSYQSPSTLFEEEEDDSGMGRGKRKRRASSAAMASTDPILGTPPVHPISILSNTTNKAWIPPMHRRSATAAAVAAPASAPKLSIPRLRLRLTPLEEAVDSMDDSDAGSDVVSRRWTKKKVRRAASEGGRSKPSTPPSNDVDDDDEDFDPDLYRSAFSSVSSSALLAQSLLAASKPTTASVPISPSAASSIAPGSLHLDSGAYVTRPPLLFSASAPNPLASFPSILSPDAMDLAFSRRQSEEAPDSAAEDDFHETMLRGEDFDFEWGSESYTTSISIPSLSQKLNKGKNKEIEVEVEEVLVEEEEIGDDTSTPATTPRSPPKDEEADLPVGCSKGGLEATLCDVFDEEVETVDVKPVLRLIIDRVPSNESLPGLEDEEEMLETAATITAHLADPTELTVPLPSPLALGMTPMLSLGHVYSSDFDFVGMEDDRSAYRNQFDRTTPDSADDEESEDDDIITVKIEDEGSIGSLDSVNNSRASSAYPTESFSRRLIVHQTDGSDHSESSSDGDFDPHSIVTNAMLASGDPVPQAAPSPPELGDWTMQLDMDELDLELGNGVDLLGPESVGLDELDLAWGGLAEKDQHESMADWQTRQSHLQHSIKRNNSVTFLTQSSPTEYFKPLISHALTLNDSSALVIPTFTDASTLTGLTRQKLTSPFYTTQGSPLIVYPITPLSPSISALVVQRGVAVFATTIIDSETLAPFPLLRKIDSDYVNATVLLKASSATPLERETILSKISETFKITGTTAGLQGTWVSLFSARSIADQFLSLKQYEIFLEDDLGMRFPDPIASLRAPSSGLNTSLSITNLVGTTLPPLPEISADESQEEEEADQEEVVPMRLTRPKRLGRGRRTSGANAGVDLTKERQREREGSPEIEPPSPPGPRKTRRTRV